MGEAGRGGLPYSSWDRMGRDIFMVLITTGVGALLTFVVAIGERVNEIHRQVAVNQNTIGNLGKLAQEMSRLEARLVTHEHMEAHHGATTNLTRLELRVETRLARIENQLESLLKRQ